MRSFNFDRLCPSWESNQPLKEFWVEKKLFSCSFPSPEDVPRVLWTQFNSQQPESSTSITEFSTTPLTVSHSIKFYMNSRTTLGREPLWPGQELLAAEKGRLYEMIFSSNCYNDSVEYELCGKVLLWYRFLLNFDSFSWTKVNVTLAGPREKEKKKCHYNPPHSLAKYANKYFASFESSLRMRKFSLLSLIVLLVSVNRKESRA